MKPVITVKPICYLSTLLTEVIDSNNDTVKNSHVYSKALIVKPQLNENSNRNTQTTTRKFYFQKRGLYISNINIYHLKSKLDEVKLLLSSYNNVDVFGIFVKLSSIKTLTIKQLTLTTIRTKEKIEKIATCPIKLKEAGL